MPQGNAVKQLADTVKGSRTHETVTLNTPKGCAGGFERVNYEVPTYLQGTNHAEAQRPLEHGCLALKESGVRRALRGYLATTGEPELGKEGPERHGRRALEVNATTVGEATSTA